MRPTLPLLAALSFAAFVAPGCGLDASQQKAREIQSTNNLRQIALAWVSYHDAFNYLPMNINVPTGHDTIGPPLLSWRVAILPFLGKEEQALFEQFRVNEPWDSPHNKPLAERMPKVFLDPRLQDPSERSLTHFVGFAGNAEVLDPKRWSGITATTIEKANGLANTFLVVEAAEPVPWTKPADLPYDRNRPLPKLASKNGFFLAVFGDTHAQRIPSNTPEQTLRFMIEWNNTQKFQLPKAGP